MEFLESITVETKKEVIEFLAKHPDKKLSYWDWRESHELALRAYKELENSTKGYGEAVDGVLKAHNLEYPREITEYERYQINKELGQLSVIENVQIHKCLDELLSKTYY